MSIRLTGTAYAEFRRIRREHAPKRGLGPRWTILGSDVLFAALDAAGVAPEDLLQSMARTGDPAELGNRSPLFSRLLQQLPSCSFIRTRLGIVEIRCGSKLIYIEKRHRPVLVIPGSSLPEQVAMSLGGVRLSNICDVASMPALAIVDPVVTSARNVMHVPTGRDHRVELELEVGWRPFGPAPLALRDGIPRDDARSHEAAASMCDAARPEHPLTGPYGGSDVAP